MQWLTVAIAGCAAVVTFIVGGQALSRHSTLRFGWVIAACVAALVFLSLYHLGEKWMSVILLPYAALGLALLGMLVFLALRRGKGDRSRRPDDRE